jgi:hypothetical protein
MRLLALYLRTRRIPRSLPAAVAVIVVLGLLGDAPDHPSQTVVFVALALALGFAVLGYGLGGADAELERTGAIRWTWWRSAHAVAIAAVVSGAALLTFTVPAQVAVRDAAGLAGLTVLAAALLGNQLAWLPAVGWVAVSVVIPPVDRPAFVAVLTWPVQPPGSVAAAVTAAVLAVAGLLTYALRGSRPSTADRESRFRAPRGS